jgi:hypothetical protein
MIVDLSEVDLRIISASPGAARLLDQKCDHCGQPYRVPPCAKSDHYRTFFDLALDAGSQPHVSFGCKNPKEQQAQVLPIHSQRRHPYSGKRPESSGYCTDSRCACECHRNEVLAKRGR